MAERDVLGEYMASQQRVRDRPRQKLADALRLPPSEQAQENPFIKAAVAEVLRKQIDAKEKLLRDHFADTPLALESVLRTGVMPWNIEVQVRRFQPEFDEDPYTLRIHEDVRVVEYPRA